MSDPQDTKAGSTDPLRSSFHMKQKGGGDPTFNRAVILKSRTRQGPQQSQGKGELSCGLDEHPRWERWAGLQPGEGTQQTDWAGDRIWEPGQ